MKSELGGARARRRDGRAAGNLSVGTVLGRDRAVLVAVAWVAVCCGFAGPAQAVDLGSAITGATYGVVPRAGTGPAPSAVAPAPAPEIAETSTRPAPTAGVQVSPAAPIPSAAPEAHAPMPAAQPALPPTEAAAMTAPPIDHGRTVLPPPQPTVQPAPAMSAAAPSEGQVVPAVAVPSQAQVVPAVAPARGMTTGPGSWDALRAGDALEIRFYRNNARQTERYLIQPGDILRIDVVDHPDVSRDSVTVAPDGYISAPLIGSVEAAGKTVDQVRQSLVGHYEAGRLLNPDVSVSVVSADQRIESLLRPEPGGGSPGMRVTVSTDGYLDLPFIPRIRADRPIDQVQSDIKAAYSRVFGPRLEVNANLVEHTVPVIYVAGQVTKPTEVPLVTPLTPVAAIGAAGGFLPVASPENVHVIRFRPDGSYKDFKFKLDADLKHSDPAALTFRLHPQDVVFVPKSGVAKANDFVEQYIRNMLPIPVSGGFVGF